MNGKWKKDKERKKEELRKKYKNKAKGFKVIIEEMKQRISAKLRSWDVIALEATNVGKINFFDATQNNSGVNWRKILSHIKRMRNGIWKWNLNLELENVNIQENVEITTEDVTMQLYATMNSGVLAQEV